MADKKPFDQAEYIKAYQQAFRTRVSVILNRKYDADIIEHLERQPKKSEYIKKLIRADMTRKDNG